MKKFWTGKKQYRSLWLEGVKKAEEYMNSGEWVLIENTDTHITFRNLEYGGTSGYAKSKFDTIDMNSFLGGMKDYIKFREEVLNENV